jgi:Flp pilus assembly protein TadD
LGKTDSAHLAFIASRDEDIAPLRAITPITEIVTEVAKQNGNGLVDFVQIIEELSPDGIPGNENFLDHVHPTIEANRLLALAIIDEMTRKEIVTPASTWNDEVITEITDRVISKVDKAANATALTNLSRVLNWAGKQDEALRLVDSAIALTTDQHSLFQKVNVLLRNNSYKEALPYSVQASRLMPDIAVVRMTHGVILAQVGRNQEALHELETAARLDPSLLGLYYPLGLVYYVIGDHNKAERMYLKALEQDPKDANTCNNLGILFAQRGDIEKAMDMFERALKINPRHIDAMNNLQRVKKSQR